MLWITLLIDLLVGAFSVGVRIENPIGFTAFPRGSLLLGEPSNCLIGIELTSLIIGVLSALYAKLLYCLLAA